MAVSKKAALMRKERFVELFLATMNGAEAYQQIHPKASRRTAQIEASRYLSDPYVVERLAKARAELTEKTGVTAEALLREFWAIGTADTNELVEYRRVCCRYCHGKDHKYQFTVRELERKLAEHEARYTKEPNLGLFNEQGGTGYDRRKPPHPDCPECFGEGEGAPFFKDSRNASPEARKLYAGVRVTDKGTEMKLHGKESSLKLAGQLIGAFKAEDDPDRPPAGDQVIGTQIFIIGGQRIAV